MSRARSTFEARWQAWWAALAPREQRLLGGAALLVGLALLWWVALAPALRTLAAAPAEHARLDAQLQDMGALQAQARALQAQPRAHREESLRALESALRQSLGPNAQMQASGGDAVGVALRTVPADALGAWLAQARANARALPREVHLTRSQATPATALSSAMPGVVAAAPRADTAGGPARIQWDGTVVMNLPAP
ncbi:MAG: type II secretion system protein M [Comamonadaceae bacterium]|nr:MAG: type II secretion system protein M [Comamonadaceae bacterium]